MFEDTIRDLFKTADTENKGYVTVEDFTKVVYLLLYMPLLDIFIVNVSTLDVGNAGDDKLSSGGGYRVHDSPVSRWKSYFFRVLPNS